MNARNYFAVVAGTSDDQTETIESIRKAEKEFFDESELFMTGVVKVSTDVKATGTWCNLDSTNRDEDNFPR